MTSNKKLIQQLKRPDSFQVKTMGYLGWAEQHKIKILAFIAGVAVVIGGFFAWKYVGNLRSEQRRQALAAVDIIFNDELEAAGKQQQVVHDQIVALEKKIEEAEKQPKSDSQPASLAAMKAEVKTLEGQRKAIKAKHDSSREKYLAFYKANKNTAEGWRAALQVAAIAIEQEQYAEAASLLKEILPQAKGSYFYAMQIRATYISLLEEIGEWESALAEAEELLKLADEGMMPRALLIKGRLLQLSGRSGEAKEIYKKIITEHNTSYEAGKAKAYSLL